MNLQTFKVKRPAWLPPGLAERLSREKRLSVLTSFSRADKKVMRKRRRMRLSDWVEKHRVLTMSAIPGTWHNRITPYLTGIMDASIFPSSTPWATTRPRFTTGAAATGAACFR